MAEDLPLKYRSVVLISRALILRFKRLPSHQLKLMITIITSKNSDFRVSAWLNLK